MREKKNKRSGLVVRFTPLARRILALRKRLLPREKIAAETAVFERLYVGEDAKKAGESEQERNALISLFIAFAGMALVFVYLMKGNTGSKEAVTELTRPAYGTSKNSLMFDARSEGESFEGVGLDVEVEGRRLEGEEREKLLESAADYAEREVFSANESRDCIRSPLNLIDSIPGTDVRVTYPDLDARYIRHDGNLKNKELEGPVKTLVKILLDYHGYRTTREYEVTVYPPLLTLEEQLVKDTGEELDDKAKGSPQETVTLPGSVDGYELTWYKEGQSPLPLILPVVLVIVMMPLAFKKDRENRLKKRKDQMTRDYSQVVGKLSLLLGAGMTVRGAWEKVCEDYIRHMRGRERRFAYEEMLITCNEMKLGKSQTTAIEQFGRRCDLKEYGKLSKIITSNLKHGSKGLTQALSAEADESLAGLKEYARRKGEEAGTKLLAPMIIMLVIVMAIVMVPALMSFKPL